MLIILIKILITLLKALINAQNSTKFTIGIFTRVDTDMVFARLLNLIHVNKKTQCIVPTHKRTSFQSQT